VHEPQFGELNALKTQALGYINVNSKGSQPADAHSPYVSGNEFRSCTLR